MAQVTIYLDKETAEKNAGLCQSQKYFSEPVGR
jgi:hypothetical protein